MCRGLNRFWGRKKTTTELTPVANYPHSAFKLVQHTSTQTHALTHARAQVAHRARGAGGGGCASQVQLSAGAAPREPRLGRDERHRCTPTPSPPSYPPTPPLPPPLCLPSTSPRAR